MTQASVKLHNQSHEQQQTESDFLDQGELLLDDIEIALENCEIDLEFTRISAGMIEVEVEDHAGQIKKIVLNLHTPMKQIWLASPLGAYHFHCIQGHWHDTRDDKNLFARLSHECSILSGKSVHIRHQVAK
jgi:CyaY protein